MLSRAVKLLILIRSTLGNLQLREQMPSAWVFGSETSLLGFVSVAVQQSDFDDNQLHLKLSKNLVHSNLT
jgi:hypothetical protein